jgi:predicted GIY-YIG superfamily endonuclease
MTRERPPAVPAAPAVYLLHLASPVGGPRKYAGHYLGETENLAARLRSHRRGRGSKLLAAARRLGIGWRLVRTWGAPADRAERLDLERRLKNAHGPHLCPACNPRALRWGTLTRYRVAAVKWPRPRRYGRSLDDGPLAPAPARRGEPVALPVPFWAAA